MPTNDIEFSASLGRTLVAEMREGVCVYDLQFKVLLFNHVMEQISGYPSEEIVGRLLWDCFPFLKQIGEDKYLEAALAGTCCETRARPFQLASGRQGLFDAEYSPLRIDGDVRAGIAIVQEVTDRIVGNLAEQAPQWTLAHNKSVYPELAQALGHVILQRRKLLDLSQEELASRAHLHRTFISDVERGARNISVNTLCKIARALHMPTWLLLATAETFRARADG